MSGGWGWSVAKAVEVLSEVNLCDRCLGRLFGGLARGVSNAERGRALRLAAAMDLHRMLREGQVDPGRAVVLAARLGSPALEALRLAWGRHPGAVEPGVCAVCGGKLDSFIEEAARGGIELLRAYDVRGFVVGVRVDQSVVEAEESIRRRHGLVYGESIRSEIRREVGKRIQALSPGLRADFEEPEATLLLHYPSGTMEVQVNSLLLAGRYWKRGRMISQAYWPSPEGPRYFSVEQAAWGLLRATGGERLVVHAAGREDVDARMLGTGRPVVVEVKAPRRRRLPMDSLEEAANEAGRGLVAFKLAGVARRRDVASYKEEAAVKRKAYKALVVAERPLSEGDLARLESELEGRLVLQRTPTRVLHRRPDILRRRRVYRVKCRPYPGGMAECLIAADGGLYVKELVSGDGGRTTPSFSEILGVQVECVELDVVSVEGVRLFEPRGGVGALQVSWSGQSTPGLQAQNEKAAEEARQG